MSLTAHRSRHGFVQDEGMYLDRCTSFWTCVENQLGHKHYQVWQYLSQTQPLLRWKPFCRFDPIWESGGSERSEERLNQNLKFAPGRVAACSFFDVLTIAPHISNTYKDMLGGIYTAKNEVSAFP